MRGEDSRLFGRPLHQTAEKHEQEQVGQETGGLVSPPSQNLLLWNLVLKDMKETVIIKPQNQRVDLSNGDLNAASTKRLLDIEY